MIMFFIYLINNIYNLNVKLIRWGQWWTIEDKFNEFANERTWNEIEGIKIIRIILKR